MPTWSRPERTVKAPDGDAWELYVTRSTGLRWRQRDGADLPDYPNSPASLVFALLEIPLFVLNSILLPAASYLVRLPLAMRRARRTDKWTVEAVCWWPHERRYRWTVNGDHRGRVLAEIADGISEGRWAQPLGAVFHGELPS